MSGTFSPAMSPTRGASLSPSYPVVRWRRELDRSGNGVHGTLQNFSSDPRTTDVVAGASGKSINFVEASQQNILVQSDMGGASSDVSISLWVKPASTSESGAFVKMGDSGGIAIGVGDTTMDGNGNNIIGLYENIRWLATGDTIGTGWHHIGFVINASGHPEIYLDGTSVYSDSTGAPSAIDGDCLIGGYEGPSAEDRWGNYELDEVRVYDAALIAANMTYLYNSFRGEAGGTDPGISNLQGHWSLD